jgi:hypothetical protein
MAQVTRRSAFYDVRDWWLSHARIAELLGVPHPEPVNPLDPPPPPEPEKPVPFFPVAQMPESQFPFVRYYISRVVPVERWWMHQDTVGLDIYMKNLDDSLELMNMLIDISGKGDRSVRELNIWLGNQTERPSDFLFHSMQYLGGGDAQPSNEEGGIPPRTLMFRIDYSPKAGEGIV